LEYAGAGCLLLVEDHSYSEGELLTRIEEVKDKIIQLKDERRRLIEELRRLRDERRRLIEERRRLIEEFKSLRERLRELKSKLAEIKAERDKVRKEALDKREDVRIARQLAEKEGEVARVSLRRLQKRLEELEWRQMTTVMRPEEERRLVEEIARIESMIMKVKEARKHVISVLELEADYKATLLRLKDLNNKMAEVVEEIKSVRLQLQGIAARLDELSSKVGALTQSISDKSSRVDEINRELDSLYNEYRGVLGRLRDLRESRRLGIQLELLERKRREVREKAERGEPLTLEELRILYGELDEEGLSSSQ
jgi:uncharacterized coiled-coil DUF342 family protein